MKRLFLIPLMIFLWLTPPAVGADEAPATDARQRRLERRRVEEWFAASAQAQPAEVRYRTRDGGSAWRQRCGTPPEDPLGRELVASSLSRWERLTGGVAEKKRFNVPLAVHVLRKSNGLGDVTDAQIDEQIALLEAEFQRAGFDFETVLIERVTKKKWFNGCSPVKRNGRTSKAWRRMTERLAVDPANVLNIYTCRPKGALGVAFLPWSFEEDSPYYSVMLDFETLPGGAAFPYDEGDTGVHEVGHAFGLFHTFENGCEAPGDEVGDTPFEAEPAFGCPVGRNTCPGGGADPVTNYMDYSDDACLEKFSKGQRRRMRQIVDLFRPGFTGN